MLCFLAVGSFAQLVDQFEKFRLYLGEILMRKRFLRSNENIDAPQGMVLMSKQFAQQALHVISLYGTACRFLSDDQSHASMFQCIRHVVYDQELS